jgi:hypothetical protein
MRALLSTFRTFMPTAYMLLLGRPRARQQIYRQYRNEMQALRKRDATAARAACEERAYSEGEMLIAELIRRDVFHGPPRQPSATAGETGLALVEQVQRDGRAAVDDQRLSRDPASPVRS